MSEWNFNDNYRELMGLISSAFQGRNSKREEEIVMMVATLFYLRKNNSLRVVKATDVQRDKDHVIMCLDDAPYNRRMDYCLCCDEGLPEQINDFEFRELLVRSLAAFREASEPSYVLEFVNALNRQEFEDGELLALLDRKVDELLYLSKEDFGQPREISQIVSCLVDKKAERIFDPFGGLMDFAIAMPDRHFVGYEVNDRIRNLALFRMALAGIDDHTFLHHDTAENWTDDVFDAIVTYPPLSHKLEMRDRLFSVRTDSDLAVLSRFEKTTNLHGQLVMVTSLSTLFRETSGMKECREYFTLNNWLDAIIVLPGNVLKSTQIVPAILVLKKDRKQNDRIRFVDASQCVLQKNGRNNTIDVEKVLGLLEQTDSVHSIDVTTEDILRQDSSWLVGWYLYLQNTDFREGYEVCSFGDVLCGAPSRSRFDERVGHVVSTDSFMRSSLIRFEFDPNEFVMLDDLRNARKITEPVLLVHLAGASFPIYCNASEDNPVFVKSPVIGAYSIMRNDVHIGYLCVELFHRSMVLNRYISLFSNRRFFELIQLSFPSMSEQEYLYEDMKRTSQEAKMKELGLQDVIEDYKKQFRVRKHAILQNLSAFSALWNTLYRFKTKNGGQLADSDIVSVSSNRTAKDVFDALNERLNVILLQADHIADDEPDWGEPEEIEPDAFIEEFIKTHDDIRFDFIHEDYDEQEYQAQADEIEVDYWAKIVFPKKALTRIFENIVSNAIAHGFTDEENNGKRYKIVFSQEFVDIDCWTISIANNGKALPESFNLQKTFDYGYTTKASEGHSGLGAYQVNELMRQFGGSVEVISTPNELFTVTYVLTFRRTNIN